MVVEWRRLVVKVKVEATGEDESREGRPAKSSQNKCQHN